MMGVGFCAALSRTGKVEVWPWKEHKEAKAVVLDHEVIDISCGDDFG